MCVSKRNNIDHYILSFDTSLDSGSPAVVFLHSKVQESILEDLADSLDIPLAGNLPLDNLPVDNLPVDNLMELNKRYINRSYSQCVPLLVCLCLFLFACL